MDNKIFEEEEKYFNHTLSEIDKKIESSEAAFSKEQHHVIGFTEGLRGTQFNRQAMMSLYATEANRLKSLRSNPYFGRFDFIRSDSNTAETFYIGKKTVYDTNYQMLVYDWRCNLCSMYYDYNIGEKNAFYYENDKAINGVITDKRQIRIENGKLIGVTNQDTLSNDQVIINYLDSTSDSRLKTIIATIQKDQNKIIRNRVRSNYIVQGVAGSGKTTVALHRIAYLLYNETKQDTDSGFLIMGPTKYFFNYIATLLPELDIESIEQITFEKLALDSLKLKLKIESKNDTLQRVLNNEVDVDIIKYKSSVEFLKLIEKYIKTYIYGKLDNPIMIGNLQICSNEGLKRLVETQNQGPNMSYSEILTSFSKKLIKSTRERSQDLCHQLWQLEKGKILSYPLDSQERKDLLNEKDKMDTEIKNGCPSVIKKYFEFLKVDLIKIYQAFIENIETFADEIPVDVSKLKKYTLSNIKDKKITSEDVTVLLYMQYLINGITKYDKYTNLVIDEGQDLSLAQYFVIKKIFSSATFDVYGDINQSIYDYCSIKNWKELNDLIFNSQANLLDLNKSYRTTTQISDAANLVLNELNYTTADCIARDGSEVEINMVTPDNIDSNIMAQIKSFKENNYKNIAIICKDNNEVNELYKKLKKQNIDITKIDEDTSKYAEGIVLLPSYLSKGLEFDAVIISDASANKYTNSPIDLKLLYVSLTRAMHGLYVNYSDELTDSLRGLKTNKNVQLRKNI